MADIIYNSFLEYMADGTIDLDNDVFKGILLDNGHTPSAAHTQYSDVSGDELATGNGYTAGGVTLSCTWVRSGTSVTFDCTNPQWTSATLTAAYFVIYDDTASGDPLVGLWDFGGNYSVTAGTYEVQVHASGLFVLQKAT